MSHGCYEFLTVFEKVQIYGMPVMKRLFSRNLAKTNNRHLADISGKLWITFPALARVSRLDQNGLVDPLDQYTTT